MARLIFGLGTPGNVYCTIPQVVSNLLDFNLSPQAAIEAPRILPLGEDNRLITEDRVAAFAVQGLARMGIGMAAMPAYDWHMGSFQMCFRDGAGLLGAAADSRRCGVPGGLD